MDGTKQERTGIVFSTLDVLEQQSCGVHVHIGQIRMLRLM